MYNSDAVLFLKNNIFCAANGSIDTTAQSEAAKVAK